MSYFPLPETVLSVLLISTVYTVERASIYNFLYRISEILPMVLEDWKVSEIPGFDEKFPQDIKLNQAIAAWKFIVQYHQTSIIAV